MALYDDWREAMAKSYVYKNKYGVDENKKKVQQIWVTFMCIDENKKKVQQIWVTFMCMRTTRKGIGWKQEQEQNDSDDITYNLLLRWKGTPLNLIA